LIYNQSMQVSKKSPIVNIVYSEYCAEQISLLSRESFVPGKVIPEETIFILEESISIRRIYK